MAATKDAFFNPAKLTSQQKSAATEEAARQIISAETNAREAKTEKLRRLRLEQAAAAEAVATPEAAAPKRKRATRA